MDQALYDRIQELQQAALFRASQKDGSSRIVNSPFLRGPISSAFERLARFEDPTVEIGRLGIHTVHNVCWGLDPAVEDIGLIDQIPLWTREGAITVRRMAGGRC